MKIAIMQPYVFPYIGYFQLINAVDTFVFYDDVNFIKKGFINRNTLLVDGEKYQFTIPCKSISQNKLILEIDLSFDEKSKSKLLKTIEQAYQKAPFFNVVFPLLEQFINNNASKTISDFAIESVKLIANYLNIKKKWIVSSINHYDTKEFKKEQRLIQIAKKEQTTIYINPIGGIDLYDKEDFDEKQLTLKFLRSEPSTYKQFTNEFVPYLSIIDVIMFNSIDKTKSLLNQYKLI